MLHLLLDTEDDLIDKSIVDFICQESVPDDEGKIFGGQIELRPKRLSKGKYYSVTHTGLKILNHTVKYTVRSTLRLGSIQCDMKQVADSKVSNEVNSPSISFEKKEGDWFYHTLELKGCSSHSNKCQFRIHFVSQQGIPVGHTPFLTMKSTHPIQDDPDGYPWAEGMIKRNNPKRKETSGGDIVERRKDSREKKTPNTTNKS